MKKILLTFLIAIVAIIGFAQGQTDEQLAIEYYRNGEYEKAVEMFDKIYSKNPNSYIYYTYYQTLLELQDYDALEKVVKKKIKTQPTVQRYKIDLGYAYERANNVEKAQKVYEEAIAEVDVNENAIKELYNAFISKALRDYAIQTLIRGRKLLKNEKLFSTELTTTYAQLNRNDKIIEEALALVGDNDSQYLNQSEAILQNLLIEDEDNQKYLTIKSILQKEVQKNPSNTCYLSLLFWVYKLNKDYPEALILAKSIDKRDRGNGEIVFDLARIAASNRDYETAIEAFEYVISKGENSTYFTSSQFELLNVKYARLTSHFPVKMADALNLEQEFKKLLEENGIHSGTSEWIRKYVRLLAFYVDKQQEAINILNQAIANADRDLREKATYKVDLADIQLYMGNVWDATLNYSQVDKDFPNDTIGQLAKFKNAKLSFYIGEFNWAKSQLDVLRAATSKLIANDAMYFSLLISDNEEEEEEEVDSLFMGNTLSNAPLRYYAKADFLRFQNKDEDAFKMLDSVLLVSPYGPLDDDVLYQKAQILIRKKDYFGAEILLKKIVETYSSDILADDATFQLAELYEYYLKDIPKAMEYYEKVMKEYPGSLFVVNARKQYRILRGDIQ